MIFPMDEDRRERFHQRLAQTAMPRTMEQIYNTLSDAEGRTFNGQTEPLDCPEEEM